METRISNGEARDRHAIETKYGTMPNGERRFRLLKADGSAYIRTEIDEVGGWQESHYHEKVRETYIVDRGWVAYARESGTGPNICLYHAGDLFTTEPYVIHNIYMSPGSVIHTVKHGASNGADRKVDAQTVKLDELVKGLTEREIWTDARQASPPESLYTEEYRHFDTLIWQAPAWASAIFAISLQTLDEGFQNAIIALGLPLRSVTTVFWTLMSIALLCFSFVLWRFRVHQSRLKRHRTPWYSSAASYTQILITAEAAALACLAQLTAGIGLTVAIIVSLMTALAISSVYEVALRRPQKPR